MLADDAVAHLLASGYDLVPISLERQTPADPDRAVWIATEAAGQRWTIRLLRSAASLPPWVAQPSPAEWLGQQADLLRVLAAHGAVAPALRFSREGDTVLGWDGWHALVLAYVPGQPMPVTAALMSQAAAMVARLHRRGASLPPAELEQLMPSWWGAGRQARDRALALLADLPPVPNEWAALLAEARTALLASDALLAMPSTIIHGDCWPGNMLLDPTGRLRLIDWEHAGRGSALLDLGSLLSDCFAPNESSPQLAPELIAAVMAGYQQVCPLDPAAWVALPAAIVFGAAFRVVIRCWYSAVIGWSGVRGGLGRERQRLALAAAIGAIAATQRP